MKSSPLSAKMVAISPGIPDGFHGRKFGSQKRLFSKNGIKRQARELHDGLEIKSNFTTWFDRMCEYGFTENDYTVMWSDSKNGNAVEFEKNADYILVTQKKETNNPKNLVTEFTDYQISVDMAKQICMRDWKSVKILICSKMSGFKLRGAERFSRMCEYGFFNKMDYLEVIVKNDENSKGGRPSTGLYDLL